MQMLSTSKVPFFLNCFLYIQDIKFFLSPAAQQEYEDLKRELSRISRMSSVHPNAVEEGKANADEFNLDEFLNGLRDEHDSAGHLPKNLGVSWKNLTVKVTLLYIKRECRI
jgi:hypothetical protein